MALVPSFEAFERGWAEEGRNQLVYTRLAADLDTPVSLMLKLSEARTDSFHAGIRDRRRGARPTIRSWA